MVEVVVLMDIRALAVRTSAEAQTMGEVQVSQQEEMSPARLACAAATR
ncbi:hypothetical protein [Streptomyces sp. NPDC018347]